MVIFLVYSLLTLVVTWPLASNFNRLIIDPHDGLLITWILNWNIHNFLSFDANIFFPYKNTLAFSDYHFLGSLVAFPLVKLTGEPLFAYNFNILLGFSLTAFATYLLTLQLTKKKPVSFLAGLLFSFSTIHLNYLPHLQLFTFWPIIFSILFLIRDRQKLFYLFFFLSTLNSPLNFYFHLLILVILKKFRQLFWGTLFVFPFFLPYLFVSRQFSYTRPITDAIHFSLQFPDLLNISQFSRLSDIVPPASLGTPAYFGLAFLTLFMTMIISLFKKFPEDKYLRLFLILALFSFILSLGPALHIFSDTVRLGPVPAVPLPYTLFYYLLPGFSAFRTPSRWILLTAFALTVAVCIYFAKRLSWKWVIVLSILILLEINFPFKYSKTPSVSEFPPEQIWLRDNYPGAPVIQFPIYNWDDPSADSTSSPQAGSGQIATKGLGLETLREYYSTIHWHPMFNGYSGFSPKEWEEKVKWLQREFPSPKTISYLQDINIRLVLIPNSRDVTKYRDDLRLLQSFPNSSIYFLEIKKS